MNTIARLLPHITVGTVARISRPGWRLDACELPMTTVQVADAKRRAAHLLEESAKRWPAEYRR